MQIELLTESRKDLFNIAAILARGIDDAVLQDKEKPVTIVTNGTFNAGKSIFADAMRMVLMSSVSRLAFKGEPQGNEFWYGMRGEEGIEIRFSNVNRCYYHKLDEYFADRKFGGASFVQNTDKNEAFKFGIDVWLEKEDFDGRDETRAKSSPLAAEFNKRGAKEWNRYVAIDVADERLLASPAFKKAFAEIETGAYKTGHQYSRTLALRASIVEATLVIKQKLGINKRNLKKIGVAP